MDEGFRPDTDKVDMAIYKEIFCDHDHDHGGDDDSSSEEEST